MRAQLVEYPILAVLSLFVCALAALNEDWFVVVLMIFFFLWCMGSIVVIFTKIRSPKDEKSDP
jgi:hypothetical protein